MECFKYTGVGFIIYTIRKKMKKHDAEKLRKQSDDHHMSGNPNNGTTSQMRGPEAKIDGQGASYSTRGVAYPFE